MCIRDSQEIIGNYSIVLDVIAFPTIIPYQEIIGKMCIRDSL